MIQYASSLDTPAIMSKNVLDAAVMLSAIAGEDPNDSTSVRPPTERSKPVRKPGDKFVVGIPKEYNVQELSDEARAIWEEGIRYLEKQNCQIVEVSLPHTAQALSAYYIIAPAEASSNLARYDGVRYGTVT
jgi:aspartyl-tRNA(Asn)/glutamyl-tRNA(Gln) amidotransferase subunit A